ncbi:MAG: hypothetical protein U0R72_17015 [Nakamurella multipartita]
MTVTWRALVDGDRLGAGLDLDAELAGPANQGVGQGPHSADRDQPFPGAPPDQVIQKAPISKASSSGANNEVWVPIKPSVATTPRTGVVPEAPLDHGAERLLDQVGP